MELCVLPFLTVTIFVCLPHDLFGKWRIFSLEKSVPRVVMTTDFSYLRDNSKGEEVESNNAVLEILQRTMGRKHEEAGFGTI
jgi:hypothetical protein